MLLLRAGLIVGSVLVLLLLLVGFTHLSFLQIKTITVEGNNTIDQDALTASVQEVLSGSYAHMIPKSFVLLYPRKSLLTSVPKDFPVLASVHIAASSLTHVTVKVTERAPYALWCGDIVPQVGEAPGACYFMDESGYIFSRTPSSPPTIYVRYYGAVAEGGPPGQFLTPETFARMRSFAETLKTSGFTPSALLIPDDTDADLYLSNGMRVYFSQADTPDNLKEKLTSLLSAEPLKTIDPRKIDYIDLRFGNKAYYKLKE